GALYRRVAPAQQKTVRRADVGSNEAEIGGRVEEAGIPAIPRGKDLLDPFTKRHLSSPIPSRFEPIRPDSAWQTHEVAVSRAARFPPRSPADPRARACSPAAPGARAPPIPTSPCRESRKLQHSRLDRPSLPAMLRTPSEVASAMLFGEILRVAFQSIQANFFRAILTMLGIIIGVVAVIAMLAAGAGAQKRIDDQIAAIG